MKVTDEIALLVEPVVESFGSPGAFVGLLDDLGLPLPTRVDLVLPTEITNIAQAAADVVDQISAAGSDDATDAERVAAIIAASVSIGSIVSNITTLDLDPGEFGLSTDIDFEIDFAEVALRLIDHLLVSWLYRRFPGVVDVVELLGVVAVDDGCRRLDLDRITQIATHPLTVSSELLTADLDRLLMLLATLTQWLGGSPDPILARSAGQGAIPPGDDDVVVPAVASRGFELRLPGIGSSAIRLRPITTPGIGVSIEVPALGGLTVPVPVPEPFAVTVGITSGVPSALLLTALGVEGGPVDPPSVTVQAGAHFDPTARLLGTERGPRVELAGLDLAFGLEPGASGVSASAAIAPTGLSVVVSGGDSFLSSVLGDGDVAAEIDLGATWSLADGLVVRGAASLEFEIALGVAIGPVSIDTLAVGIAVDGDGLQLDLGVELSGVIGPISAAVSGLGITAAANLSGVGDFVIGPIGASVGPKPPTGIGLGLDLGVAKGGGFLAIDAEAGLYEGAIQLEVMSVGISAFVIIETKRPDVDGWSMMMALYIEIPAIQLGFGFTLSGVGGLAGINRGIDADALGDAVRSGSLDTMLFPDDPIADAPIIIDTLASIFPAADGQYVFGPVVKIGWGTPTLVSISVGVVIELPDPIRIAILGSVEAILPRPEVALVELHLDVAGIIDFEAGTIAIDATLHNSSIVGFALAGDMSLRAGFKDDPTFLFSLGGFHPDFEPPAGFPALRRLSIGLNAGPMFRISFECYIAITSNTVQFGTAFEIVAKVAGFGIEGGFEFDALIQFNPFKLKVSVGMHISVTALSFDLMGVWLRGNLEGPNPWHITGYAEFRALGMKKEVNVDEIIGSRQNEIAPEAPNLLELIVDALNDPEAWAAGMSPSDGVTLAAPEPDPARPELLVGPHGNLEVGQNVVPLNETINKFGNAEDVEHIHFELTAGGGLDEHGTVRNWFSPGQFAQLKNKERLAAPSFEEMDAGVVLGGGVAAGVARAAVLGHEPILLDTDYEAWELEHRQPAGPSKLIDVAAIIDQGVFATATLVTDIGTVVSAGAFGVAEPTYAVADELTGATVSEAGTFLAASVAQQPGQVIAMVGEEL